MTGTNLSAAAHKLWAALRGRGGQIAYCGGVALALTAIAFAAESYRRDHAVTPEAQALPALDLSAPSETEAPGELRAPEGALLRTYSEAPVWNASLGLWESHAALDYRMEGGAVKSLGAGIVRAVSGGGAYGGCVEVECGELLLRYASIEPDANLRPGDEIEAGDRVGAADASMPGEAGLGPHLHLEAIRDGAPVNCAALLSED